MSIYLEKIPFKSAINTMSVLLILVIVFHLLIFTQVIPYDIVWGGKLQNVIQMRRFEAISIFINALLLAVILIKGKRIERNMPSSVIDITLWLFVLLFSVNTVGNLFSNTSTETILFTPLTFISAILCYRIAIEKNKLKDHERQDSSRLASNFPIRTGDKK